MNLKLVKKNEHKKNTGISIPIYGIMNLKPLMPWKKVFPDLDLNSHLWDYEPETWPGAGGRPLLPPQWANLNSHLWDYEPETLNLWFKSEKNFYLNSHLWDYEPETRIAATYQVGADESQFPFMGL